MMTPMGGGEQKQKRQRRQARRLRSWQRMLLGFYVAFFALLLPLICWGALAEPGHPHRFPHFVFATPVLAAIVTGKATQQAPAPAAQHASMPHGVHWGQPPVAAAKESALRICGLLTDGAIPGRAAPMLMAFALLLLVFFAAGTMHPRDLPHFATWQRLQLVQLLALPVPLPPPRLCHI